MTRAERQPIHHKKSVFRPVETGPAASGFDVNDPVGNYIRGLYKIPLLTSEQEIELATRMDAGKSARQKLAAQGTRMSPKTIADLRQQSDAGFAAEEELIIKNRRLVVSVAKKYQGRGVPFLDLIQEGNIGLMRGTKKYDVERGKKFSTYTTWWIRQAILRAIAEQGSAIRTPFHAVDLTRKIMGIGKRLTQELGREPTSAEIAAEIPNMTPNKVEFYMEKNRPILSLQQPTDENENTELGDFIADPKPSPDTQSTQNILEEHVAFVLSRLPPREALIIKLRYGLNSNYAHTLQETGDKLGITRERVRQIEAQALSRLRLPDVRRMLRDYLNKDGDR
ncbi:MAG: sigma-70 family RNA polymerase sigma factor [Candidatus Gottesmanbacteria bacterium]|nr:sigma-70 family RNA polymerase sigma factor [Candidatus Gottesmanbacteria bacterium]